MFTKFGLLFSFISSVFSSSNLSENEYQVRFLDFVKKYEKSYEPHEIDYRYNVFKMNVDKIMDHNNNNLSWRMDINKFADLTSDEFSDIYKTGLKMETRERSLKGTERPVFYFDSTKELPSEVDWVAKGAVTAVKDQGQCGSCWAFSTTGSVEGAYFLSSGKLVSFSEQELVDCSEDEGNQGCNGGLMDNAFTYLESSGICKESDYKYTATDGKCKKCTSVTKISSFVDVEPNNEQALMQAVSKQPISVAIEADQSSFQFYSSGVLTADCGSQLDHGVLLVGYGDLNGIPYWRIKNSWGSDWGDQGYILLAKNISTPQGQCGILSMPSFPVM